MITPPAVIHLGPLRSFLARGLLILGEVVVVPGALLYAFVTAGHPMLGLLAVFGWRAAWIGSRLGTGTRVPTTCWFAFALFLSRTGAGLALSSVSLYLVVPITLCAAQGIAFLGSSATRRPLMMRLAIDYTAALPPHPALRGLFAQLSGIWGAVHLVCAALGAWALLALPTGDAVAITSGLGLACSAASAGGCLGWALWRTSRIAGLRIAFREPCRSAIVGAPSAVPAAELAPAA